MPVPRENTTQVGILGRWDQVRTVRMTITPEQAKYLLEHHMPKNRPRSPHRRAIIVRALKNGHWKFNGECIIFDRLGWLKNGQHRLSACVETGIALDTNVAFGVEPDVFDTIDRVKPRSLPDDLAVEGETGCLNLSATIKLIYGYVQGQRATSVMSTDADSQTCREFLAANPGIRGSAQYANGSTRKAPGLHIPIAPRVLGACHYLFGQKAPETRDRFFAALRTGEGLAHGDPVLTLRARVFIDYTKELSGNAKRAPRGEGSFVHFIVMIRAWNAVRQGRKLTKLQIPYHEHNDKRVPDPLPEIV